MPEVEERANTDQAAGMFADLLKELARPAAFPFAVAAPIPVIQTHASAVLLAGDYAYKLKKPKDFGFFDYSTPALRRHFCQEEVRLNARLAPDVYLGIASVLLASDGRVGFGPTLPPEQAPEPGTSLQGRTVVDYAVVMTRLPDEATLEALVRSGTATPQLLAEVAERVAAFHASVPTDEHISAFGEQSVIKGNWEENFAQTRPYVGRVLDAAAHDQIANSVRRFLQARQRLFEQRRRAGRIRDCHGDLRLQHVYVLGQNADARHRLAVIDCIEFNERFRYGDVAGEVAFLAMELDAAGRSDLSRAFVEAYVRASSDETLRELLPFYACYRAYVRGKVAAFQLDEPEVPEAQRQAARQQARALFTLAAHYAAGLNPPTLLLVGGVMGTGKSTLAKALQREPGWALCSSDATRKRLADLQFAQPQAEQFEQGLYSQDWTTRTYQALLGEAQAALSGGRSVVLDASFARRAHRQAATRLTAAQGARAVFIECVCPPDIALQRLARRWTARVAEGLQASAEASLASDGRPDLYERQRARWEAFDAQQEPRLAHVQVDTTGTFPASVEQALAALEIPRFACWL
ncbi:MAG TPA: AAA family ATPase [Ktedonobacterales bacterium]|nr:AAA family ATPase [Ktedonobacterales bacterium]